MAGADKQGLGGAYTAVQDFYPVWYARVSKGVWYVQGKGIKKCGPWKVCYEIFKMHIWLFEKILSFKYTKKNNFFILKSIFKVLFLKTHIKLQLKEF